MYSKGGDENHMACKTIALSSFVIFIELSFYLFSFLCDVCNEIHEHMQ